MRRILAVGILLGIVNLAFAQKPAYRIEVNIDGLKDTSLLLGYHFGDKKFVTDTAKVNSNGVAVFEGDSLLKGGIYLVILPEKTYFEILVDNNQNFSLHTSKDNLIENLKFTNSDENNAFVDYQRFMIEMQKQSKTLSDEMKDAMSDSVKTNDIKAKLNDLNNKVENYWNGIIDKHTGTFLAVLVKAMETVNIPEYNIPKNTEKYDSLVWAHNYQYNKVHYFDNINFADERMLRTPILEARINNYFDRVLLPMPDSIIQPAIDLIEKTKANKDVYQYVLSYLVNKFQTSERMGMDAVFVALANKYYLGGQVWWADQKLLDKIAERVKALKPNLIGNISPDLWLPDTAGKYHRLSDIKTKIAVVYFWDPECSHCKKTTPELKKTYDKFKSQGLEIYAVYTQGDQPKWMDYIAKNGLSWINVWDPTFSSNFRNLYDIYSTPVIYVLDSNKKILAKRISVESLNSILEQELKK